jgi:hypothetical protein
MPQLGSLQCSPGPRVRRLSGATKGEVDAPRGVTSNSSVSEEGALP